MQVSVGRPAALQICLLACLPACPRPDAGAGRGLVRRHRRQQRLRDQRALGRQAAPLAADDARVGRALLAAAGGGGDAADRARGHLVVQSEDLGALLRRKVLAGQHQLVRNRALPAAP